jgi:acyl-CoA reductase-like NAD-dependent aldehyde dehydrogenase
LFVVRISSRDTGKTMVDASLGEIMTTCEKITWLLDEGEKWLKPEYRSPFGSLKVLTLQFKSPIRPL